MNHFYEKTGIFGFAWRSPQLESSAVWDKDGVLWTTPWGEKMKFRPKKKKLPKNAVKIALHEDAKKGKGYYSPYSDWEADTSAKRPEISGNWTFSGKKYTVYYFMRYDVAYLGKVRKVVDGRGRDVIDFRYDKSTGRPIRVRDRLGNDINFEWDANAYISRQTKRTAGSSTIEPVRSYVCDKAGNPVSVSELDADGKAVRLDTNIHGAMKIGVMV